MFSWQTANNFRWKKQPIYGTNHLKVLSIFENSFVVIGTQEILLAIFRRVSQTRAHGDFIQIFYKCFKTVTQAANINQSASLTQFGIFKASRASMKKQKKVNMEAFSTSEELKANND